MSGGMRSALFVALCVLLLTQINHLSRDFGVQINYWRATMTAGAFILAINVCYSAAFDYLRNGNMTTKMTATMAVIFGLTLFASWISVNASIRAFAQQKHQVVMNQEAGTAAMIYRNQMVRADIRMNELAESGVTGGPEYDRLLLQAQQSGELYNAELGDKPKESAYSKALTGGSKESEVDTKVRIAAITQAIGLEGLCAALSILLGLGAPVHRVAEGVMTETKKPRAQSQGVSR